MQRREMIEKIIYTLSQHHPALDYPEVAEAILDRVEELGMRPPPHAIRFVDGKNDPREEINYNWEFEG